MSGSNPAVPAPTHIGKFEIVKELGAGAMGKVYKAKDPELDRFVAIKTIRLEGLAASQASLDDLIARFKREARLAASLKHPNIVTIHEIGSMPGNSYLVLEFIDGPGLDRVIKGSGKMAVERAAALGIQVADALDFAWRQQKLVHRDIKPANIMIEPGDHVKVTDFGIAKLMTGETVDHLTATGSLLGTPAYMSPEQARGQELDGRSDLFSLGCILYEMLAGQRAFRGDSITALLFKIVTEEPPSLRELDPTVTDAMLQIIAKALKKNPDERYQSGRELAEDLHAITQPGFVPTLRSRDAATILLPPDAPSERRAHALVARHAPDAADDRFAGHQGREAPWPAADSASRRAHHPDAPHAGRRHAAADPAAGPGHADSAPAGQRAGPAQRRWQRTRDRTRRGRAAPGRTGRGRRLPADAQERDSDRRRHDDADDARACRLPRLCAAQNTTTPAEAVPTPVTPATPAPRSAATPEPRSVPPRVTPTTAPPPTRGRVDDWPAAGRRPEPGRAARRRLRPPRTSSRATKGPTAAPRATRSPRSTAATERAPTRPASTARGRRCRAGSRPRSGRRSPRCSTSTRSSRRTTAATAAGGRCASCTTRACSCSTSRSTRRASSGRATASG